MSQAYQTSKIIQWKWNGFGEAVTILNRTNPAFYCVPVDMYERLMNLIEDKELLKLAEEAQTEETVKISLNDLRARVHKNRA